MLSIFPLLLFNVEIVKSKITLNVNLHVTACAFHVHTDKDGCCIIVAYHPLVGITVKTTDTSKTCKRHSPHSKIGMARIWPTQRKKE